MMKLNHKPLFEIETAHNPKGLNAVSHVWDEALENQNRFCVATPSRTIGYVQIDWYK